MSARDFSRLLLRWYRAHGRHDLPWRQQISPYRVWVSEIMLQQTQVATVIPYFERFMKELPDVAALAAAEQDHVLHLWTGLGYYSRARNLHAAARIIEANGVFPDTVEALSELPGIGRSTAGAIAAIAFGRCAPILDGNAKRVLARFFAVPGWPGRSAVGRELWACAERVTPARRAADFSQAIMDLGATVCTRSAPDCGRCPLARQCRAYKAGEPLQYPGKRPARSIPTHSALLLLIVDDHGDVLLEKRPASGVWGGLWSPPQLDPGADPEAWCHSRGFHIRHTEVQAPLRHTFSHYHFDMRPLRIAVQHVAPELLEGGTSLWYNVRRPQTIGLAAPVKKLLQQLADPGSRAPPRSDNS